MPNTYFSNLAFPWLLYSLEGRREDEGAGTLFELDPSSVSKVSVNYIQNIRKTGWYVCPLGWAVYARSLENGILILPGLKVFGVSTISQKSTFLQIKLEKRYVEEHVENIISNQKEIIDSSDGAVRSLIHEIRTANAALKNASYELLKAQNAGDVKRADALAGNISALSDIFSARMDAQDVITAFESVSVQPKVDIAAFKKFDKIVRSYQSAALERNVKIRLVGECHSITSGPDLFEMIPFLLIENAVKYSPPHYEVVCSINDKGASIECSVESTGPQIFEDEAQKIFEKGYRGKEACRFVSSGDGLGLHVLKKTVERLYGGKVYVAQTGQKPFYINKISFSRNKFVCLFPRKSESSSLISSSKYRLHG